MMDLEPLLVIQSSVQQVSANHPRLTGILVTSLANLISLLLDAQQPSALLVKQPQPKVTGLSVKHPVTRRRHSLSCLAHFRDRER